MLITFALDNWKSFRDRAELRMTAVSAVRPRERLFFVPEYRMRLLPVAALHGKGNGSANRLSAITDGNVGKGDKGVGKISQRGDF